MMKINELRNNPSFTQKAPTETIKAIGKQVAQSHVTETLTPEQAPAYLRVISRPLRKLAPFIEDNIVKKFRIEDLINVGNVAKELVCMVVYPLQVLTNPDLPKKQRRFVGLYDFFVTCFSLAGTLLFLWKGKKISRHVAKSLMKSYTAQPHLYPKVQRAIEGGAFVLGIAVQTILFKRILAPALSPPLAGRVRKALEANDTAKGESTDSDTVIPPQYDAARNEIKPNEKQNKIDA